MIHTTNNAPPMAELIESARRIYRAAEMSANIMRDPGRTGGWEGAERTASAFERQAIAAKTLHDCLAALASAPADAEASVKKASAHIMSGDYRMAYFAMCEAYGKVTASAPAGDGVEAALKFALTVKAELVERAPTYSIQSVEREHFDRAILAIAALASPRAAVGEREAEMLAIVKRVADSWSIPPGPAWGQAARAILAMQSPRAKVEGECPSSPDGRHQVDTTMESGPNNCFHCEASMGGAA